MAEISVKLIKQHIKEAKMEVKQIDNGSLEIKAEAKAQLFLPSDDKADTAMLQFTVNLSSEDCKTLSMTFITEFIFKFDPAPSDYDDVIEKQCIPIAQEEVFNKIDDLLNSIGYPPLKLNDKAALKKI